MTIAISILRAISLLAFAGPALMHGHRVDRERGAAPDRRGSRSPVVANFAAFGLFFALLFAAPGTVEGPRALALAALGTLVALLGAAVGWRARAALGAAWSFVPRASEEGVVVATGPYRVVRHPIYLGICLLALGEAIAFASAPAGLAVVAAVLPSFVWRARVEEALLLEVFGSRYRDYRSRTRAIIPALL